MRHASDHYRDADFLWGFIAAEIVLALLLFLPQTFLVETMPVDLVIGFVLGAFLSAHAPELRRLLVLRRRREESVLRAARAAFVELGVARTRGRSGVLVYVSVLERRVVVLGDLAIDAVGMGERWRAAIARLDGALRPPRLDELVAAIGDLGAPLAAILPHAAADLNELPDEVSVE